MPTQPPSDSTIAQGAQTAAVSTSGGRGADPFSKLHRMSTTAGVGSHDYVAVNTPAVITFFAGLFSGLSLVSLVLLVIPAFAVVAGVVALVQVAKSNGTQAGRLLAGAGMLLALSFSGFVGWREYQDVRAFEQSRAAIRTLITDFAAAAGSDAAKAYELTGPGFQSRTSKAEFTDFLKMVEGHPAGGKIVTAEWNERLEAVQDSSGQGLDIAQAIVRLKLERAPQPVTADTTFMRRPGPDGTKGPWRIESFGGLFEKPAQQPQRR